MASTTDKHNKGNEGLGEDPVNKYPKPPFPKTPQEVPGTESAMNPKADHGEQSYRGKNRLAGKVATITGGDTGIGKAVAVALAREGADVLISYLDDVEDRDAEDTVNYVREAGREAIAVKGDISSEAHCQKIIETAVDKFGKIDILVNNAAYQMSREKLQDIPAWEWEKTFAVNMHSMFYLCKAAEPHMAPGGSIINTTSVNAYEPNPTLLPYAATKAAIQNFTSNLNQLLL